MFRRAFKEDGPPPLHEKFYDTEADLRGESSVHRRTGWLKKVVFLFQPIINIELCISHNR